MKALVLSGGGSKGCLEVGILRSLLNRNLSLDYDIYVGSSVGALNATILSSGPLSKTLPILEDVWLKQIKSTKTIASPYIHKYIISTAIINVICFALFIILSLLHSVIWSLIFLVLFILSFSLYYLIYKNVTSIFSTDPLRKLIDKNIDMQAIVSGGKTLRICTTCYETGKLKTIRQTNPNLKDWVLASSAFPIFFPMVKIGGNNYIDGGVRNNAPVSAAIDAGADEIDVILSSPLDLENESDVHIGDQLLRVIEIMSSELLKNDLFLNFKTVTIYSPNQTSIKSILSFKPDQIRAEYARMVSGGYSKR